MINFYHIKTYSDLLTEMNRRRIMTIKYNKEDLRDHIGVGAIIYDSTKTKILMLDHVKLNLWTIPVGKVDQGSNPEKTLIKEIQEECNIIITKYRKLNSFKKKYLRCGKLITVILHDYEVLEYEGTPKNNEPEKHRDMIFMTIDEVKELHTISDATITALSYFNDKGNGNG